MEDVTSNYYTNENYVKNEIKCTYKDISVLNNELRWQYDNRIAVPGWGMLNPEFGYNFVIKSGVIGYTDWLPVRIRQDFEDTDKYRFVKYNGSDQWIY